MMPSLPKTSLYSLGNTLVDTFVNVEEHMLAKHNLVKGSMHLIKQQENMQMLLDAFLPKRATYLRQAGGSAGNVATFFSRLGGESHFIGQIGADKAGEHLQNDMKKYHVQTHLTFDHQHITGQCLVLITPDAQRTMCTFLGAGALCHSAPHVPNNAFFYVEGYVWDSEILRITAEHIINDIVHQEKHRASVVLSLADHLCVERHHTAFKAILSHVAIVVGNEQEICALAKKQESLKALHALSENAPLVIMTAGENGLFVVHNGHIFHQETLCHKGVIDTTGAGDACIAGFLYGQACCHTWQESAWIGQKLSRNIITQQGTHPEIKPNFASLSQQDKNTISKITQQI